ncbi:hypothetical protein AV654_19760 [Paenibacillus elgii]|uniref:Uncharacterized protein n=1 Tax=Paenibacillus elgii TaxID=189691 RepID=A0A163XP90_9BACL|nr:hypothetical protein [Paenibacillus elgii]KZE78213.1 hypothetical protein AV654_19760 [Paenibacillus elgii]
MKILDKSDPRTMFQLKEIHPRLYEYVALLFRENVSFNLQKYDDGAYGIAVGSLEDEHKVEKIAEQHGYADLIQHFPKRKENKIVMNLFGDKKTQALIEELEHELTLNKRELREQEKLVQKLKVIEAKNSKELEEQYQAFLEQPRRPVPSVWGRTNQGDIDWGSVGYLAEVLEKQFSVSNGCYFLLIFYTAYELAEGFNHSDYTELRHKCNALQTRLLALKED